jgi:adenylate cyclase
MKEDLIKYFQVTPAKITLFVILLAVILFFIDPPFLRFIELKSLDLRIASRGSLQPGNETVIAAIDEKSLTELGRWPWPRTTIARLIDSLKAYGAKTVGFDIVFSEPDNNSSIKALTELNAEMKRTGIRDAHVYSLLDKKLASADTDAALAQSIARAKNVTLGYFFHFPEKNKDDVKMSKKEIAENISNIQNSRYQIVKSSGENPDDSRLPYAFLPESNIPILSQAAQNSGYFNMIPDSDGSNRWSPLVVKLQNNFYSSLATSMVIQFLGWPTVSLDLESYGVDHIRIGDIRIPTDDHGRLLVNYMGPEKTFPHYSITDIIQGRLPAEKFRNKIVLIGATAVGIYDLRVTPFSAAYPGVEIHANVIDNILHQNFLQYSSFIKFIDILVILVFGLIIGLTIHRLRAVTGMIVFLIAAIVFLALNLFVFSNFNIWMNLTYPLLTMVTIYFGIIIYRYITEEREKKKIRGAFQYYLTASVINEMLKDPTKLKLGGDKKDLSVLFSDIRGFTTISEKLTPEELVHLLNEYLTAMTDIVFKYDGTLDKYMGDAIMAVFGAPLDQPDHARRACSTALDMLTELKRLQKKWQEEGKPFLNIGVGVNSGDMVVGNMGSEMRFDYTVMGDMVNLGSRLEGINKEYGSNIIISEFTYNAVKDSMCCRELDFVRVKGKKLPVRIYELLGTKKDENKWKEFIVRFEEGLALYRNSRWDESIAVFQKVLVIRPEDAASTLYIERCKNLKENPPPAPWDGVFTMTRK